MQIRELRLAENTLQLWGWWGDTWPDVLLFELPVQKVDDRIVLDSPFIIQPAKEQRNDSGN